MNDNRCLARVNLVREDDLWEAAAGLRAYHWTGNVIIGPHIGRNRISYPDF